MDYGRMFLLSGMYMRPHPAKKFTSILQGNKQRVKNFQLANTKWQLVFAYTLTKNAQTYCTIE